LSDLAIGFAANNRVHIGSSFSLGEEKLARACSRMASYVRFAGEADNAKLDRARRMSATDPKRKCQSVATSRA
jgi:hypothetical protein